MCDLIIFRGRSEGVPRRRILRRNLKKKGRKFEKKKENEEKKEFFQIYYCKIKMKANQANIK
jgi:hypothetical protein